MINILISEMRVSYETLEDARSAALSSGLLFWKEMFDYCAKDDAAWNDFLNELCQEGHEDIANDLNDVAVLRKMHRWVLMSIVVMEGASSEFKQAINEMITGSNANLITWLEMRCSLAAPNDVTHLEDELNYWRQRNEAEVKSHRLLLSRIPAESKIRIRRILSEPEGYSQRQSYQIEVISGCLIEGMSFKENSAAERRIELKSLATEKGERVAIAFPGSNIEIVMCVGSLDAIANAIRGGFRSIQALFGKSELGAGRSGKDGLSVCVGDVLTANENMSAFKFISQKWHEQLIDELISAGWDVNEVDAEGANILFYQEDKSVDQIKLLIEKYSVDCYRTTKSGDTLLMTMCRNSTAGRLPIIQYLIEQKKLSNDLSFDWLNQHGCCVEIMEYLHPSKVLKHTCPACNGTGTSGVTGSGFLQIRKECEKCMGRGVIVALKELQ